MLMIPGPCVPTDRVKEQGAMPPINHIGELCMSTFKSLVAQCFYRIALIRHAQIFIPDAKSLES